MGFFAYLEVFCVVGLWICSSVAHGYVVTHGYFVAHGCFALCLWVFCRLCLMQIVHSNQEER